MKMGNIIPKYNSMKIIYANRVNTRKEITYLTTWVFGIFCPHSVLIVVHGRSFIILLKTYTILSCFYRHVLGRRTIPFISFPCHNIPYAQYLRVWYIYLSRCPNE